MPPGIWFSSGGESSCTILFYYSTTRKLKLDYFTKSIFKFPEVGCAFVARTWQSIFQNRLNFPWPRSHHQNPVGQLHRFFNKVRYHNNGHFFSVPCF